MTLRLTLGIDPGVTGAIAVLADGEPVQFVDLPGFDRPNGGRELNPFKLAASLRGILQTHPGASVHATLEEVGAFSGEGRRSGFRFGEGFGIVKGVLGSQGIAWSLAPPKAWKKHFGLQKTDKDDARIYALRRFPSLAHALSRKKDIGRADALLIALYAWETEAHVEPAFALTKGRGRA